MEKEQDDMGELIKPANNVLAVIAGDGGLADSIDEVAAIVGRDGTAFNNRYGIAYCPHGGQAKGGPNSVAFSRAGGASSGGGGCSRVNGYNGTAEVGAYGVAIISCPGDKNFGRILGGEGSVLVITFRTGEKPPRRTIQKVAVVGSEADGIRIEEGKYYTLDEKTFCWVAV